MLDGLQYVIAQIAVIVAVAALLAGVLGWLIGRASGTRRAAKATAASPTSRLTSTPTQTAHAYMPRHSIEAEEGVPAPVGEEVLAPVAPWSILEVAERVEAPVVAEAAAPKDVEPWPPVEPVAEPVIETTMPEDYPHVAAADDDDADDDPDRTVLRPAPGMTSPSKTPQYAPPQLTVVAPTLSESELVARPASVQEVQELRRELRAKELELGKLEAGALSAWDRTVPHLEAQISDLLDENASLRRQIREAEEHSDADAHTVERLRSLVAERDSRIAKIRAQS